MSNPRVRSVRRIAPKPKKKHWFKPLFTLTIVVSGIVLLLLSPIFDIKDIYISGNSEVSVATIKQTAGLDTAVNIFTVNSSKTEQKLEKIPYIKSAHISKTYPDSLSISVTERKVCGYINYKDMDTYILIDEDGMALETKTSMEQNLPIIVGLSFENFAVGEIIKTQNQDSFKTVVTLSKLFERHELKNVMKIDVSDIEDIHLYIDNVDIAFGGMTEENEKISVLKELIENEKLPKGVRGTLTIYGTGSYVFSPAR